jgi:hypothetical protein
VCDENGGMANRIEPNRRGVTFHNCREGEGRGELVFAHKYVRKVVFDRESREAVNVYVSNSPI